MGGRHARWLAALAIGIALAGCTTLRELPRSSFDTRPERKGVRVQTRAQLLYEFDYASFEADTLTGFRQHPEVEGPLEQLSQFRIPYDDVERIYIRQLDWRRTGLVSGGIVGGALWVGLRATQTSSGGKGNSGGGKVPIP